MLGLPALLVLGLPLSVLGARVVVDDSSPAWTYNLTWNAVTPTSPCSSCTSPPDPAQALNQTWHDTTSAASSAKLAFTGVSVEIYTICPSTSGTNVSFTLDNFDDGSFVAHQSNCPISTYNYLVYARADLSLGQHTFVITNNPTGSSSSHLMLDYAVYDDGTGPTPSVFTSSATPSPTITATTKSRHSFPFAAVVAPAAVAVALLLLTVLQTIWFFRSRKPIRVSHCRTPARPSSEKYLVETNMQQSPHSPPLTSEAPLSPVSPLGYTGAPVIASTSGNSAAFPYDTTILRSDNLE